MTLLRVNTTRGRHNKSELVCIRGGQPRPEWVEERVLTREEFVESLIHFAAERALTAELPFAISLKDLLPLPSKCPALGVRLFYERVNSPRESRVSLDRIVPSLGYVPGNVALISFRANAVKNKYSLKELQNKLRVRKMRGAKYEKELELLVVWLQKALN